jgi:pimeloyl-ACP methyl ester carboxylesterase
MKNIAVALMLVLSILTMKSAEIVCGDWSGKLNAGPQSLTIVMHITQHGDSLVSLLDSPDQGASGIPTSSTSFSSDSTLKVVIDMLHASYIAKLQPDGKSLVGIFNQMMNFDLTLTKMSKEDEANMMKRPQDPVPPFPYKSEEVKFVDKIDGDTLAGTLTYPASGNKFWAVVLVNGSGAQNRNEEIFGHRPFLVLSDYLTRHGIAVLRYDDRGIGQSSGTTKGTTTVNMSRDAEAALDFLAVQKCVDKNRIGIIGHSEGGMIALMEAANNSKVKFIATLAAPGVKGDSLMKKQNEMIIKANGLNPDAATLSIIGRLYSILANSSSLEKKKEELKNFLQITPQLIGNNIDINEAVEAYCSPWMLYFVNYDPVENIRRVKCPVLAMNGTLDGQVDCETNLGAIINGIKGGNLTAKRYEGLNHLFQHCNGWVGSMNYGSFKETMSEEVMSDIATWILNLK